MFRRQGYSGTGIKQIVSVAGAPLGSLYHHFPGGKDQLTAEVIEAAGPYFVDLASADVAEITDPIEWIETFFSSAGRHLADSDWADACPIATITLEVASLSEPLRLATAEVFELWTVGLSFVFEGLGVPSDRTRGLALAVLAGLEGGFVLARSMRSVEPLEEAGHHAAAAMREALE